MSREPDDPNNPNRMKPPKLPHNPEQRDIPTFNKFAERNVLAALQAGTQIRGQLKEFFAGCFFAETGYVPTECELVEHRMSPTEIRFFFRPRGWSEDAQLQPIVHRQNKHIAALDARNAWLYSQLVAVKAELEMLKRKK